MPRYDLYHEPVKRALVKDGWAITADPFTLEYKELRVLSELEKAIGQYGLYRSLLRRLEPERELFLAVP